MGSSESFEEDLVTYEGRSGPISLESFEVTTTGETDKLLGVERITGGAGADQLHPGPGFGVVSGSGGNDVIDGSADLPNERHYRLVLDGGAGSDRLYGGEGGDTLWGREGDDVAVGRAGNDLIELGPGNDQAQGGPGDDTLNGDIGDDVLEGESGEDRLVGQAGSDRLRGGDDGDELYASRAPQPLSRGITGPVDTASDDVDCEDGEDFASFNPWDSVASCERVWIVRAVDIRRPHRVGHENRWLLPVGVSGAGTVTLSGSVVEGASREVRHSRLGGRWSRIFALRLRLTRSGLLRLRRLGSLQVRLTVGFLPPEGIERTAERTVKLVDRRG
jgi:Ca2+-binding RTX toxin-like protein